jgi:hypothetical protein
MVGGSVGGDGWVKVKTVIWIAVRNKIFQTPTEF